MELFIEQNKKKYIYIWYIRLLRLTYSSMILEREKHLSFIQKHTHMQFGAIADMYVAKNRKLW